MTSLRTILLVMLWSGCKSHVHEHRYTINVSADKGCRAGVAWRTISEPPTVNDTEILDWPFHQEVGSGTNTTVSVSGRNDDCQRVQCEIIEDGVSVLVKRAAMTVECEWPAQQPPPHP